MLKVIKQNMTRSNKLVISLLSSAVLLSGCVPQQVVSPKITTHSSKIASQKIQTSITPDVTPDKSLTETIEISYHPIVWDEMRQHFDLAHDHFGKYDAYLRFYNKRKTHLNKVSQRAKPYMHYIFNEVKKRDMPYEMALLPVVESGFRPTARSHQRAVGLWQFIPSTAELYDMDRNWWYDGRKDVIKSTKAALDYLQKLHRLNNNDWLLALASYNAGIGNVYKAQRTYRKKHKSRPGIEDYQPNYWEIKPYLPKETQGYVPKLLAVAHMVEYSELFKVDLAPIENEPFFSLVNLEKQVSLNQVAQLSNTPQALLASLNPGYHQPATPPNGPHYVLLPTDRADEFKAQLSSNQSIFNIQWQKHKIRSGDSLSVIARKYQTSSRAIKKLNGMKNSRIRAGKTLLIPIPADKAGQVVTQLAQAKQTQRKKSLKARQQSAKYIHKVKSGDSLWKLAKYYNVSTKQLASWNGLSAKKPLRLGQEVVIYSNKYGTKIQHTLKSGENLWLLAKRYKVSTKDIAGWNNISTRKLLKPGMKLTIWTKNLPSQAKLASTSYTVKVGDNLWDIAKANKVTAKHLASYNNLSLKSLLKPGQVLKIPSQKVVSRKNT